MRVNKEATEVLSSNFQSVDASVSAKTPPGPAFFPAASLNVGLLFLGHICFLSSPTLKSSYHRVIVGENNLKFLPIYERVTVTEVAVFVCFLGPAASPETEEHTTLPATSALEEMALYSNKRKLRQGRRSLETAVPT